MANQLAVYQAVDPAAVFSGIDRLFPVPRSGIDTESMIENAMSGYKMKISNLQAAAYTSGMATDGVQKHYQQNGKLQSKIFSYACRETT